MHHLYLAMAFLGGDPRAAGLDAVCSPLQKDVMEETMFHEHCHLFTEVDLVFFDTTTNYFEGKWEATSGEKGHSKDRRPDRN